MGGDRGPVFEAQDVEFSYGRLKVLDGLSLQVSPGEIFGILGASGYGGTTLIRLLALAAATVRRS